MTNVDAVDRDPNTSPTWDEEQKHLEAHASHDQSLQSTVEFGSFDLSTTRVLLL